MNKDIQRLSLKDDTQRLKKELFTLIQEIIPDVPNPETIAVFMETGMFPPAWLEEIFKKDVPSKQMEKIYDLMDFIHMGVSKKSSTEEVEEESDSIPEIDQLEESESQLERETPAPPNDSPVKKETEIIPENPIVLPDQEKEVSVKETPAKKFTPKKITPQPPPRKTNSSQRPYFPEKKQLTEGELAERLFSSMINSVMPIKTLVLQEVCDLVEQKLVRHTVVYDPQKKILILYDDMNKPAANFSTQEVEVILP